MTGSKSTLLEQIIDIIRELTAIQTNPEPYRSKDDVIPFPRMIETGNGGSILVSSKVDHAIAEIAKELMSADPALGRRFIRTEWNTIVRRAFGPALAKIDLDIDPAHNAGEILNEVRTMLEKQISSHSFREYSFGCTLFDDATLQPFTIGPVRFESRVDWLVRKSQEGTISAVTLRRIEEAWSGRQLRKRKPSHDSVGERDIFDAIGNSPFVCSIATNGLAPAAGREKALTAARLAMTAIALLWQTPSRALEGMNLLFDRRPHTQMTLVSSPGKPILAGFRLSHMPHGPWMKNGEWEKVFARASDHFAIVGKILDYLIDPTGNVPRPKMINTLAQALLWFHEGCRETVSLMAIVKYSAALDALACGHKARGICRLINARLHIRDNQPIRKDGPLLKQTIDEIYNYGRSRTIHGTNDRLGYDWSETRGLAEQFARLCLLECLRWAAGNSSSDCPDCFSR